MHAYGRLTCLILVPVAVIWFAPLQCVHGAGDDDQARQEWMSGYLKLERAGKASEEGHVALALQLFEEALLTFQQVRQRYPEWNPELVQFRIGFCEQQIRYLREAADVDLDKMGKPQLISEIRRLRARLNGPEAVRQRLESQVTRLRQELAKANAVATTAEQRAETAGVRREELIAQNRELARERDAMQAKLEIKEAQMSRLSEAAADSRELRKTLDQLTQRAEQAALLERRNQELAARIEQLQATVKDLQAETEAAATLKQQVEALQQKEQELSASCRTLTDAVKRAAAAKKQAEERAAQLDKDLEAGQAQIAALQKDQDRLRPLAQGSEKVKQEAEALRRELHEKGAALTALRTQHEETEKALAVQREEAADLRAKVAALNQSLTQARAADVEALREEREASERKAANLQKALDDTAAALDEARKAEQKALNDAAAQRRQSQEAASRDAQRKQTVTTLLKEANKALNEGNQPEARKALEGVLALTPEHPAALHRLGALLAASGNNEVAEQVLRRAAAVRPDEADVWIRLGAVLLRRNEPREAAAALLRATVLASEQAQAHHFLGLALAQLGWRKAAEDALRESFRLDETDGVTAYDLAVLLASSDQPDLDEARTWYQRALARGVEPDPVLDRALGDAD